MCSGFGFLLFIGGGGDEQRQLQFINCRAAGEKFQLLCPQELVKHTTDPTEKANLKLALDAMKVIFMAMKYLCPWQLKC